MAVNCVTCALAVHPSPIAIGPTTNAAMATGAHVSWRLRSSPLELRVPTSVVGASSARRWLLPRRPESTSPTFPPLCCICMFQAFQRFQMYVANIAYVASVLEACCKRLFKMFHLFPYVCCNLFYLDVAYVSHIYSNSMF
jgi:hypothetical protein